jgi:hypothetical protein
MSEHGLAKLLDPEFLDEIEERECHRLTEKLGLSDGRARALAHRFRQISVRRARILIKRDFI